MDEMNVASQAISFAFSGVQFAGTITAKVGMKLIALIYNIIKKKVADIPLKPGEQKLLQMIKTGNTLNEAVISKEKYDKFKKMADERKFTWAAYGKDDPDSNTVGIVFYELDAKRVLNAVKELKADELESDPDFVEDKIKDKNKHKEGKSKSEPLDMDDIDEEWVIIDPETVEPEKDPFSKSRQNDSQLEKRSNNLKNEQVTEEVLDTDLDLGSASAKEKEVTNTHSGEGKATKDNYFMKGKCGEDINYALDRNGTLWISGEGLMQDSFMFKPNYNGSPEVRRVVIEKGVKSVGAYTFQNMPNLESVEIPEGVLKIGDGAFAGCPSLKEVVVPDTTYIIGREAFNGCKSLEKATLGRGVSSIDEYAFANCRALRVINIPENVTDIQRYTFDGCESLNFISLPDGLMKVEDGAFASCTSLDKAELPNSVKEVSKTAFAGSPLKGVFDEKVTVDPEKKESIRVKMNMMQKQEDFARLVEEAKNKSKETIEKAMDR